MMGMRLALWLVVMGSGTPPPAPGHAYLLYKKADGSHARLLFNNGSGAHKPLQYKVA